MASSKLMDHRDFVSNRRQWIELVVDSEIIYTNALSTNKDRFSPYLTFHQLEFNGHHCLETIKLSKCAFWLILIWLIFD